jgi:hypothetical protein
VVVLLTLIVVSLLVPLQAYLSKSLFSQEAVFWIAWSAFFLFSDQIYGNYFMAAGSSFLFGAFASLRARMGGHSFS